VIGGPFRQRQSASVGASNLKDSIADLFRGAKIICVSAAANANFFFA
jgi:hypothetical protein